MKQYYRDFLRSVLPAAAGMLVNSLYVVVDGVFVGRGVGANGIAAINIVWPFIAVHLAVSAMVSAGGATLCSIALGRDDPGEADRVFHQSILAMAAFGAVFTAAAFVFARPISLLLGADAGILEHCVTYLRYYLVFAVPAGLAMLLGFFLRNDGAPNLAMAALVAGALANVVFDYVAIFPLGLGMMGAAVASGLGQVLSLGVQLLHFRGGLRGSASLTLGVERPAPRLLGRILRVGTPELVSQLCSPVNMFTYNLMLMRFSGARGVAVYGIIAYVLTTTSSLFLGVSQGLQPLFSRSCGKGDGAALRRFLRMGIGVNLTLSGLVYGFLFFFGEAVAGLFSTDAALAAQTAAAMRVYAVSAVFGSVTVVCITYFLSTTATATANLISVNRGFTFSLLFIFTLPFLFGETGIWVAVVAAEGCSLLLAGACFLWKRRAAPPAGINLETECEPHGSD